MGQKRSRVEVVSTQKGQSSNVFAAAEEVVDPMLASLFAASVG